VFPGNSLDKFEKYVAENGATASLLEGAGSPEVGARIQKCVLYTGEDGLVGGKAIGAAPDSAPDDIAPRSVAIQFQPS
jgi:hypothetical protein